MYHLHWFTNRYVVAVGLDGAKELVIFPHLLRGAIGRWSHCHKAAIAELLAEVWPRLRQNMIVNVETLIAHFLFMQSLHCVAPIS